MVGCDRYASIWMWGARYSMTVLPSRGLCLSVGWVNNDECDSHCTKVHPHMASGVSGTERRVAGVAVQPNSRTPHPGWIRAQVPAVDMNRLLIFSRAMSMLQAHRNTCAPIAAVKMAAEVGPLLLLGNDESLDEDDLERQEEVLTMFVGFQRVTRASESSKRARPSGGRCTTTRCV